MTLVTQPRVTVNPRAFIPDGTGGTENKIWTVRTIISVASHAIASALLFAFVHMLLRYNFKVVFSSESDIACKNLLN